MLSGGLHCAMGPEEDSPWTLIECVGRLREGRGESKGWNDDGSEGFGVP